jgi:AraC family transcriptional regulator, exoenzyme S synthesis regulatory protein ExsA
MVNLYNYIIKNRMFRKMKTDDLLFAEYKCLVDEDRGEVWSHTNYFAFGLSGKKLWKTINGKYFVQPGELLFVKKGANAVYQYFDEEFLALIIFIPDDFIKSVIEKHKPDLYKLKSTKEQDSIISIETDEVLDSYFHSLLSYFVKEKPISKTLLKLKIEELIVSLITNQNNSLLINSFKEIYDSNKVSIKEIMEANYCNNLTLEEYAKLCARSLSTFKRDFFNIYKKTPGKWLTEKRLAHSRYLMQNTKKNIDEIIFNSGFKNRSHFIRTFKNKYGTTPLKFKSSRQPLRKVI